MATVGLETPAMISGDMPFVGHATKLFRDPVSPLRKGRQAKKSAAHSIKIEALKRFLTGRGQGASRR